MYVEQVEPIQLDNLYIVIEDENSVDEIVTAQLNLNLSWSLTW